MKPTKSKFECESNPTKKKTPAETWQAKTRHNLQECETTTNAKRWQHSPCSKTKNTKQEVVPKGNDGHVVGKHNQAKPSLSNFEKLDLKKMQNRKNPAGDETHQLEACQSKISQFESKSQTTEKRISMWCKSQQKKKPPNVTKTHQADTTAQQKHPIHRIKRRLKKSSFARQSRKVRAAQNRGRILLGFYFFPNFQFWQTGVEKMQQ